MTDPPLVIGVGNRYRSDDGVGPRVADLAARQGIRSVEASGEGAGLIDLWCGADMAIVVDAMRGGGAPGTVRRYEAGQTEIPAGSFHYSSHLFGLSEAVALARELGRLPGRLVVYGIEGAEFGAGDRLSPAVRAAAEAVVERIANDVASSGEVSAGAAIG